MSNPAITETPALNSYLTSFDAANSRSHGSMTVAGRTVNVREIAGDLDDCCRDFDECTDDCINDCIDVIVFIGNGCYNLLNFIGVVPVVNRAINMCDRAITTFINDREVDCELFKRAFISMGYAETPADILQNIAALIQIQDRLQNSQQLLASDYNDRYDGLLNFHLSSTNIAVQEVIRECDMAIFFQRMLSVVNTFYNTFGISGKWVNQFIDDRPPLPEGTVRYNRNGIFPAIQEKARKIESLRARFDVLAEQAEARGERFECPQEYVDYNETIMTIPVFYATHPTVRRESAAAVATSNVRPNRVLRHALDAKTFETQMSRGYASCAQCRHPIDRENMLIDTALQDEILGFLENVIGPVAPSQEGAAQPIIEEEESSEEEGVSPLSTELPTFHGSIHGSSVTIFF